MGLNYCLFAGCSFYSRYYESDFDIINLEVRLIHVKLVEIAVE